MKRILISIFVFVSLYALFIPFTSNAAEVEQPLEYGQGTFSVYDLNWDTLYMRTPLSVGRDVVFTLSSIAGFNYEYNFPLYGYLTEEQKYLINHSLDTSISVSLDLDLSMDPSFNRLHYNGLFFGGNTGSESGRWALFSSSNDPSGELYMVSVGDYFYQKNVNNFAFVLTVSLFNDSGIEKKYDMQFLLNNLTLKLRTVGVDQSTADIVINLGKIEDSINQGFDNLGDQIGGVQDDINSGFDEVGGKLDNIQSDINTGLDNVTGAINGSGADTSGMDNGMAQLGGQLGNLGDVEDQLGGLIMDKVEVPDLILTNDQGSALGLLVSCLNLAYVDLSDYQVMFAAVLFFGIVGVLLFGRRNL